MLTELSMLNCAQQGKVIVVPQSVRGKLHVSLDVRARVVSEPKELVEKGLTGKPEFFEWHEANDVERKMWKDFY